jgi:cell wall-associated NlpC family hydrolase
LPSYVDEYRTDADDAELAALLAGHLCAPWHEIPVAEARPGDGLLFRVAGEECHVAVYIGDRQFLHVRRKVEACRESLDSVLWKRRLLGVYRHEALA